MAARRPKPDEEDPADVAAVLDATKNMGDYKLKSSPDYEVRHRVYWLIAMDTLWCRRQVSVCGTCGLAWQRCCCGLCEWECGLGYVCGKAGAACVVATLRAGCVPLGSLVLCLALMCVCLFRPTNVVWLGRYRWKSK
jgi:hypothetical protein